MQHLRSETPKSRNVLETRGDTGDVDLNLPVLVGLGLKSDHQILRGTGIA